MIKELIKCTLFQVFSFFPLLFSFLLFSPKFLCVNLLIMSPSLISNVKFNTCLTVNKCEFFFQIGKNALSCIMGRKLDYWFCELVKFCFRITPFTVFRLSEEDGRGGQFCAAALLSRAVKMRSSRLGWKVSSIFPLLYERLF